MNLEKMGQEQPTLVLLYKRHNNIRTNVGAVLEMAPNYWWLSAWLF
jgi:hypothetical protein